MVKMNGNKMILETIAHKMDVMLNLANDTLTVALHLLAYSLPNSYETNIDLTLWKFYSLT